MSKRKYDTKAYVRDLGALGFVEGVTLSRDGRDKTHYFGGIPYALPPVRFRPSRHLAPCYRYGHQGSPAQFNGSSAVCPQPKWMNRWNKSAWDENCLQLNVHIPAGTPPDHGWPVFFFIHGGFLQWGNANLSAQALARLLSETDFQCIVVCPAYRLNAFGFLTSKELRDEAQNNHETCGNNGFWDQRLALEWTWKNISLFGGNQAQIVVGGYSAGAHSAFQQLAHELYMVPRHKSVIKGVAMFSNSPGVQPKSMDEHQKQFDELLQVLGIPSMLSPEEKLAKLRSASASEIVDAQDKMKLSEFRALSDGAFISLDTIADINSGDFARRMKQRGIRLLNGENRDEHYLYRAWRTPADSYSAVKQRLCADYPVGVVEKLMSHYCKDKSLPRGVQDWPDLFGRIYADVQVSLTRGFQDALFREGLVPGKDIFRYRIEKRLECVSDDILPLAWKVTHSSDMPIWFYGLDYGGGITSGEVKEVAPWNGAFAAFVKGEAVPWTASSPEQMQRLTDQGGTDAWEDVLWQEGKLLWELVNPQGLTVKPRL